MKLRLKKRRMTTVNEKTQIYNPSHAWSDSDEDDKYEEQPIDCEKNTRSSLLQELDQLVQIKHSMGVITDMAFDAVDADGSDSLDPEELLEITSAVA